MKTIKLIDYFQYQYLFEKRIEYKKCNTEKEKFHMDKK